VEVCSRLRQGLPAYFLLLRLIQRHYTTRQFIFPTSPTHFKLITFADEHPGRPIGSCLDRRRECRLPALNTGDLRIFSKESVQRPSPSCQNTPFFKQSSPTISAYREVPGLDEKEVPLPIAIGNASGQYVEVEPSVSARPLVPLGVQGPLKIDLISLPLTYEQ
jgi:hypothetical protein